MTRPLSIAFALASCLIPSVLAGQLSGNFTVDPSGSGPRNYKSFGSAVFDFWTKGITAPVTVTVASGIYTENWGIVPIRGLSKPGALTFRSSTKHGAVLKPISRTAIMFDYSSASTPIRGVVLDGFQFVDALGVSAKTLTRDVEIKNCYFQGRSAGISATDVTRWNIHHCVFDKAINPIVISNYDDSEIHHNDIRLDRGQGVQLTKSKVPLSGALRIYNNTFVGNLDNSESALSLKNGAYGAEISHNSFRIDGDTWEGCLRLVGVLGKPTKVFSNVFVNTLGGPLLTVESLSKYEVQLDGNVYHPAGRGAVVQLLFNSNSKWDLAGWQKVSGQDGSSMQADPRFQSPPSNLRPMVNSPGVGKAIGTPAYVTDDYDDVGRLKPSTIGAFEVSTSKWEPFGTGCPGTGAKVPGMLRGGDLRMGSKTFSVVVWNALGGTGVTAFLVVGATKQTIPFGGTCKLLVAPHMVLPMNMSGSSGAGNGTVIYRIDLPSEAKLRGAKANFQWAVVDPGATGGLAFSGAATLTL